MRKTILLAFALLPIVAFSQATILSDDFESYTSGELLAANSDLWSTWSGGLDAEDAYVSSDQANSGFNSVHVVGNNGPTDLYLPFPSDYTAGVYEFSLKMYLVSGKGGYFNIQQSSTPGLGWMFEIYFDDAGGGYINAGGANAATVSYTPDAWTSINVWVDLDNDSAKLFLNSHWIHSWQWSMAALGTGTTKMMGGVDIFAFGANQVDADFYVDNVLLEQKTTTGIIVDDFERYTSGDLLAATSDLWTTWSGGINTEDTYVSNDRGSSGFNSVHLVGNNGPTDLYLPFPSDYTTGVYEFSMKMYVVSGAGGYFNIQESSTPGVHWMLEVYFDNLGGGYINAGGSNAATVSYTPDSWTDIKVRVDLTNDLGELFINSNSVYSWQWSLGSDGLGADDQVGGVDIWGAAANAGDADFYVDDVLLAEGFPTGIVAGNVSPAILIAPNPSSGQFSVAVNDLPAGEYQINILDVLGKPVSTETMTLSGSIKKNFNLYLASGIYYVRFANGSHVFTKKIVIN